MPRFKISYGSTTVKNFETPDMCPHPVGGDNGTIHQCVERGHCVRPGGCTRQTDLAGTAPDVTGMLNRRAAAPLKPGKPQEKCEHGLFGDSHLQTDLVDMAKARK